MNFLRLRVSTFGSCVALLVLSLSVGCGPKGPPKQAEQPDIPDPTSEASPSPGAAQPGSDLGPGSSSDAPVAPAAGGKMAVGVGDEPPVVGTLSAFTEGTKWGIGHVELTKLFTQTGGILWKDYDEKLTKARVGPDQVALEAEREQVKAAFTRSLVEFKDTPTGFDTTGIRGEYTYRNKESVMSIERKGKKRFFFFINDRLWKMYDEVPLADGGPLGKTFAEAVAKVNAQLNAKARMENADAAKGIVANTATWKDGASRLRLVDRTRDKLVGVVVEESSTLAKLDALRPNKPVNPEELDPSIKAVTSGVNRVDPNAAQTTAAPPASSKKPKTKKK
jgi:hypothetical protein